MRLSLFRIEYEDPNSKDRIKETPVAMRRDCGAEANQPSDNPWAEARRIIQDHEGCEVRILEVRAYGSALIDERLLTGAIAGANGL